ncbi:MAG TPA: hypothetical protein VG146_11280 [Verrucomicrobiae bacterium]|nr:hypothetical protein [Verrucomicrobiae bacterium]
MLRSICCGATVLAAAVLCPNTVAAQPALPLVSGVEAQPLVAQVHRVEEALSLLGAPLLEAEREAIEKAASDPDAQKTLAGIQAVLDVHCLAAVVINAEMRVKVVQGPAAPALVEKGWRTFLIKVQNDAGATAPLRVVSPNALSVHDSPGERTASDRYYGQAKPRLPANQLWLDLESFDKQPLQKSLSGLGLEYRVVSLYSRDSGRREAKLAFDVGQGAQDLGFRNELDVLFQCAPAHRLRFHVWMKTKGPQPPCLLFATLNSGSIRHKPSAWPRISHFNPRCTGPTGKRSACPMANTTSSTRAGRSTWFEPRPCASRAPT